MGEERGRGFVPGRIDQGPAPARRIRRCRWMDAVPTREGADALHVDRPCLEIAGPDGALACRISFIADAPVEPEIAARARMKVETGRAGS